MPTTRQPRSGSMQFWPRKRAKKPYARIRSWAKVKEPKPLGFAGYKVGMTQVQVVDNHPNSPTKGANVVVPVTVIECPPNIVIGMTTYTKGRYGLTKKSHIFANKLPKELASKISIPKKKFKEMDMQGVEDVMLLVCTQPSKTSIGKKRPELFEVGLGGKVSEKFEKAKELLGKELPLNEVFEEGSQVDIHAITTGRGNQGPTKRMGTSLRNHKSEKGVRGPANLGCWQGNRQWTVAQAGQTGYMLRTEYNKQIFKFSDEFDAVNPKGGFVRYGLVKNPYILIKGSIFGPEKRLIRMTAATRPARHMTKDAPRITHISKESKQGNR